MLLIRSQQPTTRPLIIIQHQVWHLYLDTMNATAYSSSKPSTRPTFSCIRCAERKVKCDRQKPCSGCIKHNVDCIFNATKPPRTKHKRVKVQVLADRIGQYEALLRKHGIDRSELPDVVNREVPVGTSLKDSTHPEEDNLYNSPTVGPCATQSTVTTSLRNTQTNLEFVEK